MNADAIPTELRALDRWVPWRWQADPKHPEKRKKPPYCASDLSRNASSTNAETWATFEQALAVVDAGHADGIGFAMQEPYVFLDLDDELPEEDRLAIAATMDSYTERSPSGRGLHVILTGSLNGGRHPAGIGVFQTGRFCYFTGDHLAGTPTTIEHRQDELDEVLATYLVPAEPAKSEPRASQPVELDDEELLERARAASNGSDFTDLWNGRWESRYRSQSEADLALCGSLAFWTGRDAARIDRLFRASGLMRTKWDAKREDSSYGSDTIAKAISGARNVYEPPRPASESADSERVADSNPKDDRAVSAIADERADNGSLNDEPTLADVVQAARRYMKLSRSEALYISVSLATAVSSALADEEPLWVMLIGASGSGKTEGIRLVRDAADEGVDELTRAGLLSWSTVGKKVRRAGLLTRIPPVAFVTISDFSTVITMGDREARARMFGALRVVYDGKLYRSIGGQPAGEGETLDWEGHLSLLVGATPVVDTHFAFEAALGERWLLFRLPEATDERARERTRFTIDRHDVPTYRKDAQELAAELVKLARKRIPLQLSEKSREQLVKAAFLCAHARTGVPFEGTGRYRMPVGYPMPEEPMRLAGQLHRLGRCLVALGIKEPLAVQIALQAAFDSVPLARLKALRHIAEEDAANVSSVHRAIGRGNRWSTKWELTALESIGMVDVEGVGEDEDPNATRVYRLADRYRGVYDFVASFFVSLSIGDEGDDEGEGQPTKSHTPGGA